MRIIQIVIGTTCLLNMLGASSGPGFYVFALSGDRQIGAPGKLLAEPLVARLTDEAGNGVLDQVLVFNAHHGAELIDDAGNESTTLVLHTDSRGDAAVELRLAPDAAANPQIVRVSSAVTARPAVFSFRGDGTVPSPEPSLMKHSAQEKDYEY